MARLKREIALRLSLASAAALSTLGIVGSDRASGRALPLSSRVTRVWAQKQPLGFVGQLRHGPGAGLCVFGVIYLKLTASGNVNGWLRHRSELITISGRITSALMDQLPTIMSLDLNARTRR